MPSSSTTLQHSTHPFIHHYNALNPLDYNTINYKALYYDIIDHDNIYCNALHFLHLLYYATNYDILSLWKSPVWLSPSVFAMHESSRNYRSTDYRSPSPPSII